MRPRETYFRDIMQEINSATPQKSVEILCYTSYETKLGQFARAFFMEILRHGNTSKETRPERQGKDDISKGAKDYLFESNYLRHLRARGRLQQEIPRPVEPDS